MSVGWAILGAVFLLPAMVTTSLASAWWRGVGYPMSPSQRCVAFVMTMLWVAVIGFFTVVATWYGALVGLLVGWLAAVAFGAPALTPALAALGTLAAGVAVLVVLVRIPLQNAAYARRHRLAKLRLRDARDDPRGEP